MDDLEHNRGVSNNNNNNNNNNSNSNNNEKTLRDANTARWL